MSGFFERLPVVLMFLVLIALPFLFQDDADSNEPPKEAARMEEPARIDPGYGTFPEGIVPK